MIVITKTQINDAGGELIPEGTELKVVSAGEAVHVEFMLNGAKYKAFISLKVFQLFCEERLQ